MERRINKKISDFISTFKDNIKHRANEIGIENSAETSQLLQYIYDYDRFILTKDDLMKRKRVKNIVPFFNRCSAKRACNEQCTRKKKTDFEYCGTHLKGTPHGIMPDGTANENEETKQMTRKLEIWAQNIKGIIYYLDVDFNVYQAEDVLNNIDNPRIIAKYTLELDTYHIPEFGL
jgi:hypothetical protein